MKITALLVALLVSIGARAQHHYHSYHTCRPLFGPVQFSGNVLQDIGYVFLSIGSCGFCCSTTFDNGEERRNMAIGSAAIGGAGLLMVVLGSATGHHYRYSSATGIPWNGLSGKTYIQSYATVQPESIGIGQLSLYSMARNW